MESAFEAVGVEELGPTLVSAESSLGLTTSQLATRVSLAKWTVKRCNISVGGE